MKQVGCFMLLALLVIPAARGDDPPKDKTKSPREQYQALVQDYTSQQRALAAEVQKAKGEDQMKVIQKYSALGRDFAPKFYKLAEDNPKDPVATDSLFWVVLNGTGTPDHAKAADKVKTLMAEVPMKDLVARLKGTRGGIPVVFDAALKRAVKDESDPQAAELLAWIATTGSNYPSGKSARDRLIEKYPDHEAIERICMILGRDPSPKGAETLKQILEKGTKPKVKAAAALALGQSLASRMDSLGDKPEESDKVASEAKTYFDQAIALIGKDNPAKSKAIEKELKAMMSLRVGKEALDIQGPDLDGKDFKLSDYRGKVVLLDFWGNW